MRRQNLLSSITKVRYFNRFYTKKIEILNEKIFQTPFSLTEARLIYELSQNPQTQASVLCEDLKMDKGYLSRILKRLQQLGLIAKNASKRDGRAALLSLTKKGHKAMRRINLAADKQVAEMLKGLSPNEREELALAMSSIQKILTRQEGRPISKTPTRIEIRLALNSDVNKISKVLNNSFAEFRPSYTPKAYSFTTPNTNQLRARWNEGPVWIALLGGKVVGTVAAVRKDEGLYIRSMAVLPVARGRGIGKLLVSNVQQFAKSQRVTRLFLSTTPFLDKAIRLYKQFGFKRVAIGPRNLFGTPLFTMEKFLR